MIEDWRDVVGYEGIYQVSNKGRVKSLPRKGRLTERMLSPTDDGHGYLQVCLTKDKKGTCKKVHVLVAMAFLNHVPCGYDIVVDHQDNNRKNNNSGNLKPMTHRENCSRRRDGLSQYTGVSWYARYDKWQSTIEIDGKTRRLGLFEEEVDAHNAYQEALKEVL